MSDERQLWALLYLHDWSAEGVWPEISAVYETWQEAEEARAAKINPDKYHVRNTRLATRNREISSGDVAVHSPTPPNASTKIASDG